MKSASDSCSFAYTTHEGKWKHFKKASTDHSGLCFPAYPSGSRRRIPYFCPGIPEVANVILDKRDISSAKRFFSCFLIGSFFLPHQLRTSLSSLATSQFIILGLLIFDFKKTVSSV